MPYTLRLPSSYALRVVTSVDGMATDSLPFDMGFTGKVGMRVITEVHRINCVVDDVAPKPPGMIEWG